MSPDSRSALPAKSKLDKDLKRIVQLEEAAYQSGRRLVSVGLGFVFLVAVLVFSSVMFLSVENGIFIIVGGVVGGYMALNIGANDVANNVGPAVGSRALTMAGALAIAAVFEAAGAVIAGGDVVSTVAKGIVAREAVGDGTSFIFAMTAALLAAALWINLATWLSAPVSTTHAIVGGVMGSGIAAAGFGAVNWATMGAIAASWVVSPLLGGVFAALLLAFIKTMVLYREDKVAAAVRWVPVLIALMAAAFSAYLMMKGIKNLWKAPPLAIVAISAGAFLVSWAWVRRRVARRAVGMENRRKSVSSLFTIPLIFSAALLSFAHGANDVANAVGPLAAIVGAAQGSVEAKVAVPGWVMLVGAVGIALGLVLFGPGLIRMVGEKITKLDQTRAFCVALSAAVTVIAASAMGLPVSSTHIAVGGVFGVGFLREFYTNRRKQQKKQQELVAAAESLDADPLVVEEKIRKAEKRRLVRRQHARTIVAAWVITVPAAALLAALLYLGLQALV